MNCLMPASLPDCRQTCEGIVYVLRPQFMPGKPTPEQVRKVEERFACRRGIRNVGGAVDGTHVPWQPDCEHYMEDFHNYKGWYSCGRHGEQLLHVCRCGSWAPWENERQHSHPALKRLLRHVGG